MRRFKPRRGPTGAVGYLTTRNNDLALQHPLNRPETAIEIAFPAILINNRNDILNMFTNAVPIALIIYS